jgi:hypothetical protein
MASPRALCRFDRCGDWCIAGRDGHIFADGKGSLIVVMTGESVRRWKNLAFCRISQDGDDDWSATDCP